MVFFGKNFPKQSNKRRDGQATWQEVFKAAGVKLLQNDTPEMIQGTGEDDIKDGRMKSSSQRIQINWRIVARDRSQWKVLWTFAKWHIELREKLKIAVG